MSNASSAHSETTEVENDEDIIFRVVAQRVAPSLRKPEGAASLVLSNRYSAVAHADSGSATSGSSGYNPRPTSYAVLDGATDPFAPLEPKSPPASDDPHSLRSPIGRAASSFLGWESSNGLLNQSSHSGRN